MSLAARVLWAALITMCLLLSNPGAAAAHGGAGEITVESVEVDGTSVRIVASIASVIDGHPAQPATFVIDATAADGSRGVTEIPMNPTGTVGTYQATFDLPAPGDYVLTLTSTLPPATLEQPVTAEASGTSTTPPSTAASEEPVPTSGPTTVDDDDDDAGPPAYLVAGLVGSLAVFAAGAVIIIRRRRAG